MAPKFKMGRGEWNYRQKKVAVWPQKNPIILTKAKRRDIEIEKRARERRVTGKSFK